VCGTAREMLQRRRAWRTETQRGQRYICAVRRSRSPEAMRSAIPSWAESRRALRCSQARPSEGSEGSEGGEGSEGSEGLASAQTNCVVWASAGLPLLCGSGRHAESPRCLGCRPSPRPPAHVNGATVCTCIYMYILYGVLRTYIHAAVCVYAPASQHILTYSLPYIRPMHMAICTYHQPSALRSRINQCSALVLGRRGQAKCNLGARRTCPPPPIRTQHSARLHACAPCRTWCVLRILLFECGQVWRPHTHLFDPSLEHAVEPGITFYFLYCGCVIQPVYSKEHLSLGKCSLYIHTIIV
jgi:hypothetical protein